MNCRHSHRPSPRFLAVPAAVVLAVASLGALAQPQPPVQDCETIIHYFDVVAKVVDAPNGKKLADVALKTPADVEKLEFRPGDIITVTRKGTGTIPAETWTQEWKWGGSGGFLGFFKKPGDTKTSEQPWGLEWGGNLHAMLAGAGKEGVAIVYPKPSGEARDQATSATSAGSAQLFPRLIQPKERVPPRPDVPGNAKAEGAKVRAEVTDGKVLDTLVVTIRRPSSAIN